MKLLVGLGNPGEKYQNNRHNIGFMAIDKIFEFYNFPLWKKRFQGAASEGFINGEKCMLLKPSTYMNESGRSVGEAVHFFKIQLQDIFVFHDELDIKPGKLKVKSGGGNAGHNGLKSITSYIGNDYNRVRMGIGHPGQKDIVHIYVLNNFSKIEQEWLFPMIDNIAKEVPNLFENKIPIFLNNISKALQPEKETLNPDKTVHPQAKKIQPKGESETKNSLTEQLEMWRNKKQN